MLGQLVAQLAQEPVHRTVVHGEEAISAARVAQAALQRVLQRVQAPVLGELVLVPDARVLGLGGHGVLVCYGSVAWSCPLLRASVCYGLFAGPCVLRPPGCSLAPRRLPVPSPAPSGSGRAKEALRPRPAEGVR